MASELGNEPRDEVVLTLTDVRRVIEDIKVRELIEQCGKTTPGDIGSCVEGALLDRLTEMFSEPITPVSMAEWIENDPSPEDNESCRPCALPVTMQWYTEELKAQGQETLAKGLEEFALNSNATPLTAAKELDRIKNVVGAKLRERLVEFDASTQENV